MQAFWLVLKSGGEVPSANDLKDTVVWSLRCCFCNAERKFRHLSVNNEGRQTATPQQPVENPISQGEDADESRPPIENFNIQEQGIVSELYVGVRSRPLVSSSMPDSVAGMNGMSMSFESSNAAHRATVNWHHEQGGSGLVGIAESTVEDTEDNEAFVSDINLSDYPSNLSQPPDQEGAKDVKDDIWAAAFERVRNMHYSE